MGEIVESLFILFTFGSVLELDRVVPLFVALDT